MIRAILALIAVAALHGLGAAWIDNKDLAHENTILRQQIAGKTQTITDIKHIIPHLERPMVCIDYDYSTREALWIMADVMREAGCEVEIH
jgi:tellurite resistance protein